MAQGINLGALIVTLDTSTGKPFAMNGTNFTLNQIVQAFENIAINHGQINSFTQGNLYDFDASTVINYPTLFLEVRPSSIHDQFIDYICNLTLADLVNPDIDNQLEVQSDMLSVLSDILFLLRDSYDLDPVFPVQPSPFAEYKGDRVSGWNANITLSIPRTFGWCDAPVKSSGNFNNN